MMDCHRHQDDANYVALITVAVLHAMYQLMAQSNVQFSFDLSDSVLDRLLELHEAIRVEEVDREMRPNMPASAA